MPLSGTGERVTPVLDFPSRDGLSVQAIRVDHEPGGISFGTAPGGAYVYVIDGSVEFVVEDDEPIVLKGGESFYEPPGAMHRSRATPTLTAVEPDRVLRARRR